MPMIICDKEKGYLKVSGSKEELVLDLANVISAINLVFQKRGNSKLNEDDLIYLYSLGVDTPDTVTVQEPIKKLN